MFAAMNGLLRAVPTVTAALTSAALLLWVAFEWGYFSVVGPEFVGLASVADSFLDDPEVAADRCRLRPFHLVGILGAPSFFGGGSAFGVGVDCATSHPKPFSAPTAKEFSRRRRFSATGLAAYTPSARTTARAKPSTSSRMKPISRRAAPLPAAAPQLGLRGSPEHAFPGRRSVTAPIHTRAAHWPGWFAQLA
jgi:hypothetical protein